MNGITNNRAGNPTRQTRRDLYGRRMCAALNPHNFHTRSRKGLAAVELAVLTPVWFTILIGICEIAQAFNADAILSAAVRAGCSTASRPGTANVDVISDIKAVLTAKGISTTSLGVVILVNGSQVDVATAPQYANINVTASLPTTQVVLVNMLNYLAKKTTLSQAMTIIRHG